MFDPMKCLTAAPRERHVDQPFFAAVAGVAAVMRLAYLRRLAPSLAAILTTALAYWVLLGCFETPELW